MTVRKAAVYPAVCDRYRGARLVTFPMQPVSDANTPLGGVALREWAHQSTALQCVYNQLALAQSLSFIEQQPCQAEVKEARDWEREVPRGTEKCSVTTSKVLPSPPSEDWLAEVVSSVSPA